MCIAVDNDSVGDFCAATKPFIKEILRWINRGGRLAMSPALAREVLLNRDFARLVREWELQDKVRNCDAHRVGEEQARVTPLCSSNDPHVIALVNVAHVDAVVTKDKALIRDLKNTHLVGRRRRILKENEANPARVDTHRRVLNRVQCP